MRSAKVLTLGMLIAGAPALMAQSKPNSPAPAKPAAAAASTSASATPSKPQATATPAGKPSSGAAKSGQAKPAAKRPAKSTSKPAAKKPVEKPASTDATSATGGEGEAPKSARRDPFESLVSRQQNAANAQKNLPPGKAGLQVSTLRLDGIVKAPNGMIAVVTNPQLRTYFLREGDQLYDGRVEKIAMDGVSFHEMGKDAFGKPVERQVNKRIYSSTPGEQQ